MTAPVLPRGPVMADVAAYTLTDEEKQRLRHPAVGGVILFRRNYQNRAQLQVLCADIKALRSPELVIAVDHEGGRVQRFIDGFTRLPAMRALGEVWCQEGSAAAESAAEQVGLVLAAELRACGVDLSFTPVLDLDWGRCAVIGNRSFHADAGVVSALALALQRGLNRGGMKSCGKHFPGHGFVAGDSHQELPQDDRSEAELAADIAPFRALAAAGMAAVMPAHVVYPALDSRPAGFSPYWLQQVLRRDLGFEGVIFSDDLTMEGACSAGSIAERSRQALAAGCDIVLVCNRPDLVDELLAAFDRGEAGLGDWAQRQPQLARRWQYMAGSGCPADFEALAADPAFQNAQALTRDLATPKDVAGGVKVGEAF